MRVSYPELRITVTPGVLFFLALMLLLLPLQWVLAWALCICIHECGHLLAAWLMSVRVRELSFGFGGARIETEPMQEVQELLCAAAGPLAGVILLLFGRWFPMLAVCAFFQTAINLLPLGTLDGGRIMRCVLRMCRKIPCKPWKEGVQ